MTNHSKHLTEGDNVTPADLKEKWAEALLHHDEMIAGGHKLSPIRFLIRYIIEKGYDKYCFLGTSLFALLISIPRDNKVDYTKTLKVDIDELKNIVKFTYRNWEGLRRDDKIDFDKSLKWSDTCQLTEACAVFEHFIQTFPEWKAVMK